MNASGVLHLLILLELSQLSSERLKLGAGFAAVVQQPTENGVRFGPPPGQYVTEH